MPPPAPENIFYFILKNSFKSLNIVKKYKKIITFKLWLLCTMDIGKIYQVYFMYKKAQIMEFSQYNLICMRYYIVVAMCRYNY